MHTQQLELLLTDDLLLQGHWGKEDAAGGPFCFTSTEARWLVRGGDAGGGGGGGEKGEYERLKARPRIPPEKDRRDCGPPPEQWKY